MWVSAHFRGVGVDKFEVLWYARFTHKNSEHLSIISHNNLEESIFISIPQIYTLLHTFFHRML
jgi:hypothetical protein